MYLNSGFWEVYLCCQLVSNMDVRVVSHLENLLQFLKLLSCERCPDSPFPFPLNCANKERRIAFYRKRTQGHKKIQRSRNFCKLLCSRDGTHSSTFQRCTYHRWLPPDPAVNANELLYHSRSESKVPICSANSMDPLHVNSYKTLCTLTTLALQWFVIKVF